MNRQGCVSTLLPDASLFFYVYVCKEAVLSSMIEGTQSPLSDLDDFTLLEYVYGQNCKRLQIF